MSGIVDAIAAAGAAARRCCSGGPTRARQIATAGGHPRGALALVLSILMIGSIVVAPIAATGLATADNGPRGLEKAPSDNFNAHESAGPPSHALDNVPTHAAAWDVHASAHADDLETTVDATGNQLQLIFSDDRNHQGREVAIAATALEDSLGERPDVAYGLHESGDRWSSSIEYRNGYAVIEIPRFSSNTVTFSGSVELTGNPAVSGTSYSYELSDSEEADNFTVDLTGSLATQWANRSDPKQHNGDSHTLSVGGSTSPTGPASGSPELTISGAAPDNRWSNQDPQNIVRGSAVDSSTVYFGDDDGAITAIDKSDGSQVWRVPHHADTVENMAAGGGTVYSTGQDQKLLAIDPADGSELWNVSLPAAGLTVATNGSYVWVGLDNGDVEAYDSNGNHQWTTTLNSNSWVEGIATDGTDIYAGTTSLYRLDGGDGTEVWSNSDFSDRVDNVVYNGTRLAASDKANNLKGVDTSGNVLWNRSFDNGLLDLGADGRDLFSGHWSTGNVRMFDMGDGSTEWVDDWHGTDVRAIVADGTEVYTSGNSKTVYRTTYLTESVTISVDGTTVLSQSGRIASGASVSDAVDLSTGDHTVDVAVTGTVDVSWSIKERTETIDPSVTINGDQYQHLGTLADGETTSLDVSTASLVSGTNTVNVTVSESYDGPTGEVGLDYQHTATDAQSVDYEGETFSERYNVSKTYASDRTGETLSIPWSGNVLDVRNLELRRDGSSWTTPNYTMSDGVLEVEIGSVSEGETVEIRTTGSKVDTQNGAITVVDPTVLGEELSSKIRIDDYSDGFEVRVGGTISGNETHYTHSESWSNPQTYARVGSGGSQSLFMPNAGAGEETRISTIPLEPRPQDGHVDIRVRSAGSEPEFSVLESSSTSEVELVWHDTTSGATYQLYSLTADAEVDRATANSPVTLVHDGSAETLAIFNVGGGGSGAAAGGTSTADTPPTMLIALALGGLLAIYLVSRRLGDDSVSGGMVLVAGSVLVGILSIQAMAPGILARAIGAGLESTLPILIMGAIAIVIVWLRSRGDDVTLQLGDRR